MNQSFMEASHKIVHERRCSGGLKSRWKHGPCLPKILRDHKVAEPGLFSRDDFCKQRTLVRVSVGGRTEADKEERAWLGYKGLAVEIRLMEWFHNPSLFQNAIVNNSLSNTHKITNLLHSWLLSEPEVSFVFLWFGPKHLILPRRWATPVCEMLGPFSEGRRYPRLGFHLSILPPFS